MKRSEVTDRFFDVCVASFAWAELYIATAVLVSMFDFEFDGVNLDDVEAASDQFAIGTRRVDAFRAFVRQHRG